LNNCKTNLNGKLPMAIFLNTTKLNEWIPRLINETKRELVIIVPYIKTSDKMYKHLQEANKRGVETTLIYRENKLTGFEKAKFEALDNLNLMHHPNVHCKCYYNESYLIICSMNLYEYSEINNREMGVLLHRASLTTKNETADSETLFQDAIDEINAIRNGSILEKESIETINDGFEMDILKNQKDKMEDQCRMINKSFGHKKFEVQNYNGVWNNTCKNYFDKIDVTINTIIQLHFNLEEERVKTIFNKFQENYNEYMIAGFKLYWNYYKSNISLYTNGKDEKWQGTISEHQKYQLFRSGIDDLIILLRTYF
jgi:hypothetical protein